MSSPSKRRAVPIFVAGVDRDLADLKSVSDLVSSPWKSTARVRPVRRGGIDLATLLHFCSCGCLLRSERRGNSLASRSVIGRRLKVVLQL